MLPRLLILSLMFATITSHSIDYHIELPKDGQHTTFSRLKRGVATKKPQWPPTYPTDYEVENEENKGDLTTEHTYYNMTTKKVDENEFERYYVDMTQWLKNTSVIGESRHPHLDTAYRKAATVNLQFEFPFYGHKLTNVTIATGGFCYVGDQGHSWLAATQYIAPLMANFDTISNDSTIIYGDDGHRLVVEWANVRLRDDPSAGQFTFQLTLLENGDMWFVYKDIPVAIPNISDANHPCKIGISDAYLFNHKVKLNEDGTETQTKRVIHEYHRITVPADKIQAKSVVILTALPTCLKFTDCESCANATLNYFSCSWCKPAGSQQHGFCSDEDGLHRRRQQFVEQDCGRLKTNFCDLITSTVNTSLLPNSTESRPHPDAVIPLTSSTQPFDNAQNIRKGNGLTTIFCVIAVIIIIVGFWMYYAFTNPYSMSGQLLIKYRPSKWKSPISQVRYSASIHM